MNVTITNQALEKLQEKLPESSRLLKLVYDTEGCGCAVSGVASLWHVDAELPQDKVAHDGAIKLIYESRQEVFFEDQMKLDFNERDNSFSLKSNNQIYNPSMQIVEKIGE